MSELRTTDNSIMYNYMYLLYIDAMVAKILGQFAT